MFSKSSLVRHGGKMANDSIFSFWVPALRMFVLSRLLYSIKALKSAIFRACALLLKMRCGLIFTAVEIVPKPHNAR